MNSIWETLFEIIRQMVRLVHARWRVFSLGKWIGNPRNRDPQKPYFIGCGKQAKGVCKKYTKTKDGLLKRWKLGGVKLLWVVVLSYPYGKNGRNNDLSAGGCFVLLWLALTRRIIKSGHHV
jgi:hypothetical protein